MKLQKISLLAACFTCLCLSAVANTKTSLTSPDGKIVVGIEIDERITYTVTHEGDLLLDRSEISMSLDNAQYGIQPKLRGQSRKSVDNTIEAHFYKKAVVVDRYNELTLNFAGNYSIVYRAYDDGVAYRFISKARKPFTVENEVAQFNFPADNNVWVPYVATEASIERQFSNSFENLYEYFPVSQWNKERIAFAPVLVSGSNGKKLCITEADLFNYPGMFLYSGEGVNGMKGLFAPLPDKMTQGGHNNLQLMVQSRHPYIAKFDKGTSFPWRIVIVSQNDSELLNSDMVYKLATPNRLEDISWIKPGKVAWEWWNDWNLLGVDFKTGINNQTYKYYIDFASQNGIEYVILDEGWAVNNQADLMQVVPTIDLPELVEYGKSRGVDLILWAGYLAFERDMENVCRHYSQMGIKGFKIDFMDRDDQLVVDFHTRAAETAAKYKMLVDFHGTYKPTGLHRTYPNVLNYEGVFGLEQNKWYEGLDMVTYEVTMPYIRMVAGPIDYTQGAMKNSTKGTQTANYSEPMSQGTRCRQLAQYVIFESPINMLCDSPSHYMREQECLDFISQIPTVWDETVALNGEVSEYITIARRSGDVWYLGSMTNWSMRQLTLDLSFLGEGEYTAEVFHDGANAEKAASDYSKTTMSVPSSRKLNIGMAPGGGFAMKITRD